MFKKFLFFLFLITSPAFAAGELIEIGVSGLMGSNSEDRLRQRLEAFPETDIAEVDATTNRAFISLKNGRTLADEVIARAVAEMGFKALYVTRSGSKEIIREQ